MYTQMVVTIVAKRYYICMKTANGETAQAIADMIVKLGRVTHEYVAGLSPAQWTVLRYLSRANRFSRTTSAFAEFHATTRGTASQTVKSLVAKGYVAKTRSGRDGRSSILDLTEAGRNILSEDPCRALTDAAAELPARTRGHAAKGLRQILGALEAREGMTAFGTCVDCAYLDGSACSDEAASEFTCSLRNEVLDFAEVTQICVDFRSRQSSAGG
jgi:DNA-binding MarR family transcriptional regulator